MVAGTSVSMGDDELVAAARAGTVAAFDTLVDRYYAPLVRFLARQTGDQELAADLAQETFVTAYRQLAQLAEDRSFAAWLYQIARNRLRMEYRRRQVIRFLSLDWLVAQPHARLLGHVDAADTYAEQDQVELALAALSPALREALLLHHVWGFTGLEIAQILGISPAAARKRVSRADAELRRHYAALGASSSRRTWRPARHARSGFGSLKRRLPCCAPPCPSWMTPCSGRG